MTEKLYLKHHYGKLTDKEKLILAMYISDRTEEYGDCLLWTGPKNPEGYPQIRIKRRTYLTRRIVYELAKNDLTARTPVDCKCGERACINEDHLFESTQSKIAKRAVAAGSFQSLSRVIKIAAYKRARGKLSMEKAAAIRESDEPSKVLASRYGVDKSLINKVRRGDAWVDFNNPFLRLIA